MRSEYAIKPMNCPGGMLLFSETDRIPIKRFSVAGG